MARAAGRSTAGGRAHPPPIRVDSDSAFQLALGRARDAVKTRERERIRRDQEEEGAQEKRLAVVRSAGGSRAAPTAARPPGRRGPRARERERVPPTGINSRRGGEPIKAGRRRLSTAEGEVRKSKLRSRKVWATSHSPFAVHLLPLFWWSAFSFHALSPDVGWPPAVLARVMLTLKAGFKVSFSSSI
jgi:hypothetical protein